MAEQRLPGLFPFREFVQEGGLLAYGPDYTDMYRRARRDFRGQDSEGRQARRPAMEQPTKFELVINLQDRPGARAHDSVDPPVPGRRGAPINRRRKGGGTCIRKHTKSGRRDVGPVP